MEVEINPCCTDFPTQHESIVREIEEALRKEIIAASTLPERPRYITAYTHCTCVRDLSSLRPCLTSLILVNDT